MQWLKFHILIVVTTRTAVFWDVTPCTVKRGFCIEWWCQLLRLHSISGRWTKFDCEAQIEWQGQEKTKELEEKALSQCQIVHTNPTWIGQWLNTGLPSDRPVTNCLSHGMPRNNLVQLKWPAITEAHAAPIFVIVVVVIIIIINNISVLHFCHKGIQGE